MSKFRCDTGTTNARAPIAYAPKKSYLEKICSLGISLAMKLTSLENNIDTVFGKFEKFSEISFTNIDDDDPIDSHDSFYTIVTRTGSISVVHDTLLSRGKTYTLYGSISRRERVVNTHSVPAKRWLRARDGRARSLACAHERTTAAVQLQLCVQAGNAGGGMEAARWAHSVSSLLFPFLAHTLSFSCPDVLHLPSPSLFHGQGTVILSLLYSRKLRLSLTLALFTESSAALPSLSHSSPFHYLSLVVLSPLLTTASYLPSFFDDSVRPTVYLPLVQTFSLPLISSFSSS